jgi:hypothetical protein
MKYAVGMGSSTIIYIPSFTKIGSGIQKLIEGGYTDVATSRKVAGSIPDEATVFFN